MLQKTTTFGLLGVLATGSGAALHPDASAPARSDELIAPTVAYHTAATTIETRVAVLGHGARSDLASPPAAPGGAGVRPLGAALPVVQIAVDEAVRGAVSSGLRVGAGAFARFDEWSGGDVILRVLNGRAGAAIACREPSPGERRRGLGSEPLGELILVLVAHPENALGNLPGAAVRDLIRGSTRDWRTLGGQPGAVHLVLPPPGPQSDLYARILARGDALAGSATFSESDDERVRLVMGDPHAVTVVSLEAARRAQVPTLRIDGVPASLGAVRVGTYAFSTPVMLVHRGGQGTAELTTALRRPEVRRTFADYLSMDLR